MGKGVFESIEQSVDMGGQTYEEKAFWKLLQGVAKGMDAVIDLISQELSKESTGGHGYDENAAYSEETGKEKEAGQSHGHSGRYYHGRKGHREKSAARVQKAEVQKVDISKFTDAAQKAADRAKGEAERKTREAARQMRAGGHDYQLYMDSIDRSASEAARQMITEIKDAVTDINPAAGEKLADAVKGYEETDLNLDQFAQIVESMAEKFEPYDREGASLLYGSAEDIVNLRENMQDFFAMKEDIFLGNTADIMPQDMEWFADFQFENFGLGLDGRESALSESLKTQSLSKSSNILDFEEESDWPELTLWSSNY